MYYIERKMETNNIRQAANSNIRGYSQNTPQPQPANKSDFQGMNLQSKPDIQPVNRLNALDSTLLENNAYKDIDDDAFKTEYKIEKLESELKLIDKQLKTAKSLNDQSKFDMLTLKKHSIENELNNLYAVYQGGDVSRKISNSITTIISPKKNIFEDAIDKTAEFISDKLLSKISRRFHSGQGLKIAVNKLENINKNVTELVSLQAPYGEAEEKYDQLTKYLTKANTIQYQVSKELSKENSKIKGNPFAVQTSKEKAELANKKLIQSNAKKDTAQKNALNLNNNLK